MRPGTAIPVAIAIMVALGAAARPRQPFANFAFAFLTNSFV